MRDGGLDAWNAGNVDPLLRELLEFDVVERDVTAGGWRLRESAQARLDQLAAPRPPAEKIVFFGHRCGACGQLRPTRMRSQVLLCEACDAGPAAGIGAPAPPVVLVATSDHQPAGRVGAVPSPADDAGALPLPSELTA